MIRLGIIDDEILFRKGLNLIINDIDDIEVSLEASNGNELLSLLQSSKDLPDIVLLDMNMPILNGVDTSKELRENYSDIPIVILSTYFKKSFVIHMLDLGVSGYLAKDTSPDVLELTIRQVVTNGFYYTPEVLKIIQDNFASKKKERDVPFSSPLSSREIEVLELICNQLTTGEIAEKLFISPRTVDGHRNNLLLKTGCKNTAGLVAYAITHEIINTINF